MAASELSYVFSKSYQTGNKTLPVVTFFPHRSVLSGVVKCNGLLSVISMLMQQCVNDMHALTFALPGDQPPLESGTFKRFHAEL